MAQLRDPGRVPRNDGFGAIPYPLLRRQLLKDAEQCLVPFLGAGASHPAVFQADPQPAPVDRQLLQELVEKLQVKTDDARMFLEIALAILSRLNDAGDTPAPGRSVYESIIASPSVPSAAELAQALAEQSQFDFFLSARRKVHDLTGRQDWDDVKLTNLMAALARLTAIGSSSPTLLDASSYCAYRIDPKEFWKYLNELFANKEQPTATHDLIASAAANYIDKNQDNSVAEDFLIVTTNYDCLVERAMDIRNMPYCVLTVPKVEPPSIELTFSSGAQQYLGLTDERFQRFMENVSQDNEQAKTTTMFSGLVNRPRPMVMIYKIHGSLQRGATAAKDSVIITHEDYVTFLSLSGVVPSYITTRLPKVGLLFLGYSFSDWNVRSLYRRVTRYRAAQSATTKDYAILVSPSPYETGFFDKNNIDVLDTPLDTFCRRMQES
jgi:hypothetical protein